MSFDAKEPTTQNTNAEKHREKRIIRSRKEHAPTATGVGRKALRKAATAPESCIRRPEKFCTGAKTLPCTWFDLRKKMTLHLARTRTPSASEMPADASSNTSAHATCPCRQVMRTTMDHHAAMTLSCPLRCVAAQCQQSGHPPTISQPPPPPKKNDRRLAVVFCGEQRALSALRLPAAARSRPDPAGRSTVPVRPAQPRTASRHRRHLR